VKKWAELSGGQRVVRTASTGASAATILVGLVVTVRTCPPPSPPPPLHTTSRFPLHSPTAPAGSSGTGFVVVGGWW